MGYSYSQDKLGIYIHFPFCIHKCAYCDFYSIEIGKYGSNFQKEYFESLKKELNFRIQENKIQSFKVDTVFFGGGTPSLANKKELEDFLNYLNKKLFIDSNVEISLEANPEDINLENLQAWAQIGINRINVGIQTFYPNLLKKLDRYYQVENYNTVLDKLSQGVIPRYGIDLIYGIPTQTKEMFYEDVQKAIQSNVKHLSCYSLTVEKGTNYSRWIYEKKATAPNEELQVEILTELPTYLESYGYFQYEVSNFSQREEECQHNLGYWLMKPYLGLGAGAHGFYLNKRYANSRSLEAYLKGNFDKKGENVNSYMDFILSTFRIFSLVNLISFQDFWIHTKNFTQKLEEWKNKGDCFWDGTWFKWNPKILPILDSYILELSKLEVDEIEKKTF